MWQADRATQQRFQSRSISVRLGSIASNLLLLSRYLESQSDPQLVFEQTLAYIDWAIADLSQADAELLGELKEVVRTWQRGWNCHKEGWATEVGRMARQWSGRVLKRSGLPVG